MASYNYNFLTVDTSGNKYRAYQLEVASQSDFIILKNTVDTLTGGVDNIYSKDEVDDLLTFKADKTSVYTKVESDAKYATILQLGEYYTKVEINDNFYNKTTLDARFVTIENKLTSVYVLKGTVADIAALNAITVKANGDVYNVASTGMNYVWVEAEQSWDALGSIVDLSSYYTMTQVNALLADKADKSSVYTKIESDAKYALATALGNYYTKPESDTTFVKGITVNSSSVGITKNNTTGIVNIDLSTYLSGVTGDIADLDNRLTDVEDAISDIEAVLPNKVESATYNTSAVTKTGTTLVFDTLAVDSTSQTITKASLNAAYSSKVIGFMVYCTNPAIMSKYVKVSSTEWAVEPIFLAQ